MKKMILASMALIILIGPVAAQSQPEEQKALQNATGMNEHFMMKDGKMLHNLNGKEVQMQKDMTLKNGIMIHADGSYQLKNGKQMHLRNGHCMDMNGRKYRSHQQFSRKMQMNQMRGMKRHSMGSGGPQSMMGTSGSHH